MNKLELEALQGKVSNLARVLYCLYLRPQTSTTNQTATINNKQILELLNQTQPAITKGREISELFKELHNAGLIEATNISDFNQSLHGKNIKLALVVLPKSLEDSELHSQHTPMQLTWRPSEQVFSQLCTLVGVIEPIYTADELGEFIAYWLGRTDMHCSEYTWTQKLVIHLKQRRQRVPLNPEQSLAGYQYVTPSAGIAFDENVRKLVEKYKDEI